MIAANHKSTVPLYGYARMQSAGFPLSHERVADAGMAVGRFPTRRRAGADFSVASPWRNRHSCESKNPEAASSRLEAASAGDDCVKVSCGYRLYDELWTGTPLALAGSSSGECSRSVLPRMSASILAAMPAFSFRNRLACSRPCPSRVSSKK